MLYELRIHRTTLVVVMLGLLVVGGLIFAAGFLAGMARMRDTGTQQEPSAEEPAADTDENALDSSNSDSANSDNTDSNNTNSAGFAIQVGVFLDAEAAAARLTELSERGYQPYVVNLRSTQPPTVLRSMRLGPYPTRREAEKAATHFRVDEGSEAAVVRQNPDAPRAGNPQG